MKKTVLILGTNGMLGSMLTMRLGVNDGIELLAANRNAADSSLNTHFRHIFIDLDAMVFDASMQASLRQFMQQHKVQVVVNCMGVIKQQAGGQDPVTTIAVNALFPHQMALLCEQIGVRLIHISTDCVFTGKKGAYTEEDELDAADFYGRSKALGEVAAPHLTLRTSIVGPELTSSAGLGLLSWFWRQERQNNKQIKGFTKAVFSGLTTLALSDLILKIIQHETQLNGLYHVASAPIDKFSLLSKVNQAFQMGMSIEEDASLVINRSLCAKRLENAIGYSAKSWDEQIKDLVDFMTQQQITG